MHFVVMLFVAMVGDLRLVVPAAMAWFTSSGDAFARAAGATFVTSIWQGAAIVCGLEICLRIIPRISAAHRFAIWAAGFGVAAGLPLVALLHFGSRSGVSGAADSGVAGSSFGPLLQVDPRWGLAIVGLWAAASLIRGASLMVHSIRLRRLWKAARPVDVSAAVGAALEDVRAGRVMICATEMLDRPSVIGFLAPRILIPAWLMARLTPGELEQIVLHEAEHLRRGDDWTNLMQKLARVVFPLNPALVWIEHRLDREREMACDEEVVRMTNAPRAYAACLASLAERGLERKAEALSLGAWHRRSDLVRRVHGILSRQRGLNKAAAGGMLAAVGCALLAGSVEMARAPQLVAFVAQQKSLMMSPAREQEMAALLARENAEAKVNFPVGFHAITAKVVVPEVGRGIVVNAPKHKGRMSEAATAEEAPEKEDAQQIANASLGYDRANPSGEQQWVVTAAWQEVRTVSRTSGTITDYYASTSTTEVSDDVMGQTQQGHIKTAGNTTERLLNQTSGYTFTQLILRVVPANLNSNSTQPAMSVRDGWFVIQL
jgi:BlaR1 peptidase M56